MSTLPTNFYVPPTPGATTAQQAAASRYVRRTCPDAELVLEVLGLTHDSHDYEETA